MINLPPTFPAWLVPDAKTFSLECDFLGTFYAICVFRNDDIRCIIIDNSEANVGRSKSRRWPRQHEKFRKSNKKDVNLYRAGHSNSFASKVPVEIYTAVWKRTRQKNCLHNRFPCNAQSARQAAMDRGCWFGTIQTQNMFNVDFEKWQKTTSRKEKKERRKRVHVRTSFL